MLKPDALMRLLVPEGRVKETAAALGVSTSLLYQERRPAGNGHADTGTRNSIARLDVISELALSDAPEAVRLLGKRYSDIYANSLGFPAQVATEEELLRVLAQTTREVGEALAALIQRQSFDKCAVEVEQAVNWMERALRIVEMLKERQGAEVCK